MSKPNLDPVEQKIVDVIRQDKKTKTSFTMLRDVKQIIGESTANPNPLAPHPISRPMNAYNRTVIIKLCGIIEKLTQPE
jgi:hypothetical protein